MGSEISFIRNPKTDRSSGTSSNGVSRAFEEVNKKVMEPVPSTSRCSGGARSRGGGMECSVCLEPLDAPASIDLNPPANQAEPEPEPNVIDISPARMHARIAAPRGGARGRGRGRGRSIGRGGAAGGAAAATSEPCLTDIVSTYCGHLYHNVCLQKWFTEQGRRSCPACRKLIPSTKLFRLYPSFSTELRSDASSNPTASNVASTSGIALSQSAANIPVVPIPSPSVVILDSNSGNGAERLQPNQNAVAQCIRPECRDMIVIHNTLINDMNEVRNQLAELRDDNQVKQAQLASLEEINERITLENQRLKRAYDELNRGDAPEAVPPNIAPGVKRRRRGGPAE